MSSKTPSTFEEAREQAETGTFLIVCEHAETGEELGTLDETKHNMFDASMKANDVAIPGIVTTRVERIDT